MSLRNLDVAMLEKGFISSKNNIKHLENYFCFLSQTSYQKFYRGQISSSLSQPPDTLIEIKNDLYR